jgi:hypothetical protein
MAVIILVSSTGTCMQWCQLKSTGNVNQDYLVALSTSLKKLSVRVHVQLTCKKLLSCGLTKGDKFTSGSRQKVKEGSNDDSIQVWNDNGHLVPSDTLNDVHYKHVGRVTCTTYSRVRVEIISLIQTFYVISPKLFSSSLFCWLS